MTRITPTAASAMAKTTQPRAQTGRTPGEAVTPLSVAPGDSARKVAQPNWTALGFASAEEAAEHN